MHTPASSQFRLAVPAVVAGLLALVLDQLTKSLVLRHFGPYPGRDVVTVIPHTLWFIYVRNTGSAFGLFQGSSSILKIIAIIAVCALAVYYVRAVKDDWIVGVALGLQVGGALGNIVDRFRHGFVVDWIHVPHFPTFNIADSSITVGVVLLMYALLFREGKRLEAQRAAETRPVTDAGTDG
jgi:signal peptidase II